MLRHRAGLQRGGNGWALGKISLSSHAVQDITGKTKISAAWTVTNLTGAAKDVFIGLDLKVVNTFQRQLNGDAVKNVANGADAAPKTGDWTITGIGVGDSTMRVLLYEADTGKTTFNLVTSHDFTVRLSGFVADPANLKITVS